MSVLWRVTPLLEMDMGVLLIRGGRVEAESGAIGRVNLDRWQVGMKCLFHNNRGLFMDEEN